MSQHDCKMAVTAPGIRASQSNACKWKDMSTLATVTSFNSEGMSCLEAHPASGPRKNLCVSMTSNECPPNEEGIKKIRT